LRQWKFQIPTYNSTNQAFLKIIYTTHDVCCMFKKQQKRKRGHK